MSSAINTANAGFGMLSFFILLYALLAFSSLIIAMRQVFILKRARFSEKSVYAKRATQGLYSVFFVNLTLLVVSMLEIFLSRFLSSSLTQEIYFLTLFIPFFAAFSMLCTVAWIYTEKYAHSLLAFLSELATLIVNFQFTLLTMLISFIYFYGTIETGADTNSTQFIVFSPDETNANYYAVINKLIYVFTPATKQIFMFIAMIGIYAFSALCLAASLQLLYTLLCRNINDYGRDYYNSTITEYAKIVFRATFIFNILIILHIVFAYFNLSLLPFSFSWTALLILPLFATSVLSAYIAFSENPMRNKAIIIALPLLILIADMGFIVHIW